MARRSSWWIGLALAGLWAGCNCGPKVRAVHPLAELQSPVDFGGVPVGQVGRAPLKITNQGGAVLNLHGFTVSPGLFGGPEGLDGGAALSTVQVLAGESTTIELTYTPAAVGTKASPDTGTLTAITDDPTHPMVQVALQGYGTQAAFSVSPMALHFGDVQLDPTMPLVPPTQTVMLTNIGSALAHVTGVRLDTDDGGAFTVSPPLDQLAGPLAAGTSLTVQVSFSPPDLLPHSGTLAFLTDYAPQPELDVTLDGRGVETLWQLCKQRLFDDGGAEDPLCIPTPPDRLDGGLAMSINFGARDEDGPPAHARLWAQNVGNQALSIDPVLILIPQQSPCPGGPYASDFGFASTTPQGFVDGGLFGTVGLDAGEQAEVDVTYAAQHHCATGGYPDGGGPASDDIADTAQILLSRVPQLGTRSFVCVIQGHSALPALQPQSFDFTGTAASDGGVAVVVQNAGEKALTVSTAELYDGQHQPCTASAAPECNAVRFAPGPLPLSVPAAGMPLPDGGPQYGAAPLGVLDLLPDAGALHASIHLTTDDPHHSQADFAIVVN
jgi:hypothetical protein